MNKANILFVILLTNSIFSLAQTTKKNNVLLPYRAKNVWGLSDTLGTIIVAPIYKEIKDFIINKDHNFASRYVVKTNKTYYVIDQNKKVLLPEQNLYDSIKLNSEHINHFWVYKQGKVGLFHSNKEIIPCLYDNIALVQNKSFIVQKGKLCGLINSLGNLIIPIEYKYIHYSWEEEDQKNPKFVWIAEGMLVEKKFYDTKVQEQNSNEKLSIAEVAIVSDIASEETDPISTVSKKYDSFRIFNREKKYAYVSLNNKKGVVNFVTEEEIVKPIYEDVNYFAEDREKFVFKVKLDGKFGLIKEGNIVVLENEFDNIYYDYKEGLYFLEKENKKGCIIFNTIYPPIKPKYLSIKSLDGIRISDRWQFGLFEVTTENGKGIVGENGVEFFKD